MKHILTARIPTIKLAALEVSKPGMGENLSGTQEIPIGVGWTQEFPSPSLQLLLPYLDNPAPAFLSCINPYIKFPLAWRVRQK